MSYEHDKKRITRETKRQIKKDGNRSRRRHLKKQLEDNPETAHLDDYDFKHDTSTHLNGLDKDATRIVPDNKIIEEGNES